jgi:predicted anti-sigma-YlaC factor YlaD
MLRRSCPGADKLESYAKSPSTAGRIATHIEDCPTCRKIVEDFREEAALVAELQASARTEVPPAVRRKLRQIGRDAVLQANNGDPTDADF